MTLKLYPFLGTALGTLIAYPISGVLCDTDFAGGWPSVFYIFGKFLIGFFVSKLPSFPQFLFFCLAIRKLE